MLDSESEREQESGRAVLMESKTVGIVHSLVGQLAGFCTQRPHTSATKADDNWHSHDLDRPLYYSGVHGAVVLQHDSFSGHSETWRVYA